MPGQLPESLYVEQVLGVGERLRQKLLLGPEVVHNQRRTQARPAPPRRRCACRKDPAPRSPPLPPPASACGASASTWASPPCSSYDLHPNTCERLFNNNDSTTLRSSPSIARILDRKKRLAAANAGCYIEWWFSIGRGAPKGEGDEGGYDAIVIGGGHNGLAAGAYLARDGLRTVVLEARRQGRWGGDHRRAVARGAGVQGHHLLVRDESDAPAHHRRAASGASRVQGLSDGTVVLRVPGRAIPDHDGDGRQEGLRVDGAVLAQGRARLTGSGASGWGRWRRSWSPCLLTTPPKVGSRHPLDLLEQLKLAWRMRGLDVARVGELTRLMTMSAWDLLDDWFESPQIKGAMAVDGIIGTWAGPATPGTAYVLMHHEIGDAGLGLSSWGYPQGGMGAVSDALRSSAEEFGARGKDQRAGRAHLAEGRARNGASFWRAVRSWRPTSWWRRRTRGSPSWSSSEGKSCPDDFVGSIERWNSRSGVVKINLALSELPDFTADPGPGDHLGGAIELAHSIDYIEEAFQDARRGEPARRPFSDGVIPTVFDRTLCPEGYHIMSLFTQWVPHEWSKEPHREELEAYADRVIDGYGELAPNLKGAILHRQVLGPYDMEQDIGLIGGNIFHGELSAEQLFHMRPAPGYADYRTPIRGLYQASSATHAGGGVCAIPAYNCVREIRRDRRRKRLKERLTLRNRGIVRWRLNGALRAMLEARSVAVVGASPKFDYARQPHGETAHRRRVLRRGGGGQPQVRRGGGHRLLPFARGGAFRPRPGVARGGQPPAGGADGGGGQLRRKGRRRLRERARGSAARTPAHRAAQEHRGARRAWSSAAPTAWGSRTSSAGCAPWPSKSGPSWSQGT